MAALTRQEVEAIALLSRLHLEPAELDKMQGELGAILEHFAVLAQVDTTDIAPMTHVLAEELPLRPDTPAPSLSVSEALAGAPARAGDLFVVPIVIASEGRGGS